MSYQSQIFEVMITSEEYDVLVHESSQLKEQRNRLIQEREDLKKRIELLESCGAQNESLKDNIKRLTREVLKLVRKNTEQEEKLDSLTQRQVDISRDELTHLKVQLEQQIQQVKILAQINQQLKAQIETSIPLIAEANSLKLQVHYLKEEIQKRDYLIINERNIMEKREQLLKDKESAFESIKQQVDGLQVQLEKEKKEMKEEWDKKETEMVEQFIKRERNLEDDYLKRKIQLQAEYERRIASITDFASCLELEESNSNLNKQLQNYRKKQSDYQENISIFQGKEEEYKKMINKLKKNNKQLQIQIERLKERIVQVMKEQKGQQNIDHKIIELFSTFIILFQSKLEEAGESNILEQLQIKKKAMIAALEKEYRRIVECQDKTLRKSSF